MFESVPVFLSPSVCAWQQSTLKCTSPEYSFLKDLKNSQVTSETKTLVMPRMSFFVLLFYFLLRKNLNI